MPLTSHDIYLIPGFFGFANFGDLKYFAHVSDQLRRHFDQAGQPVAVHYVPTLPTAGIQRRAARLLDVIADTAGDGAIHLIGHSTGGLDARLLASPGARLPTDTDPARYLKRVRHIVSVATPHHGTPLASYFNSVAGRQLLRSLSVITIHTLRLGAVPLPTLLLLTRALSPLGRFQRIQRGILDQVYRDVVKEFSGERQQKLERFLSSHVGEDQTLLAQLAPDALDLLNARTTRRRGVRYGCVVTRATPPSLGTIAELGLRPYEQVMHLVYRTLHSACSTMRADRFQPLDPAQRRVFEQAWGSLPDARDNDAIVPTLSQVFGEVIHAAWADHHDVIGHFDDPTHEPPHTDWLKTCSHFRRSQFEALWEDVAGFLLHES